MHPANLRDGDLLCGEDGAPFARVMGVPDMYTSGAVVVATTELTVEFPAGTFAVVDR